MSDVFHFLTHDDLRLLAEKARRVSFATGEIVLSEGSEAQGIFVLRSGRVKIEKRFPSPPQTITTLGPGEVFGEVSFIDSHPASASVIAVEASEADILDKTEVISLLASVPGLSSRFYQSLALKLSERLRSTTDTLVGL
jgi:extracellular factor (EF) 3-hydroxypalmitic acid methyl ester biosynthesis protein